MECATVGGVQAPVFIDGSDADLAGALPPSLGELGPPLTYLNLNGNAITLLPTKIGALTGLTFLHLGLNAITSVPTEIGALTGLTTLYLYSNQLTGVPTEFRTLSPGTCLLDGQEANQGFSCANVGAGTSCCTADNCGDTSTCFQG